MALFEIREGLNQTFSLSGFPLNMVFGQWKLNLWIFMHQFDKKIKKKKKKKKL